LTTTPSSVGRWWRGQTWELSRPAWGGEAARWGGARPRAAAGDGGAAAGRGASRGRKYLLWLHGVAAPEPLLHGRLRRGGCGAPHAVRRQKHSPHFCGGKPWRDDLVAVASHTQVLNQTPTNTNVASLTSGVATCGWDPNIPSTTSVRASRTQN
jgi:hypothetical protein